MKQVKLGGLDALETSAVALGIMRMAALDSDQAANVLETAHDHGITMIDSADIYGNGHSETVFGEALKKTSLSRDDFVIQSKGGIVLDPERSHGDLVFGQRYDFSKQHLIDAVDGVLKRMGVDYLDNFLLHRPDTLMEPEQISDAFDTLTRAGKVLYFGVSNFNPRQVDLVQAALNQRLIINQLQFSLMHSGMVDFGIHTNMKDDGSVDHDGGILEYSRLKHMTIQTWSPFQFGMFGGPFIDNPKFPELNTKLQALADKYGVSKNAIATAWILRHPANMQVLLGTMTPAHITDSANGGDIVLDAQEWYDLYFAAGNTLP